MLKVMSVFGTRPEAIKMAPLVKKLEKEDGFQSIVCVTAQHRQMLDQVLEQFQIIPDYDLNIMKSGQTLTSITTDVLTGMEAIIKKAAPDLVLVHGDTTTSFAAALACFYQQVPVGHVEAGLRSFDKYSPFPEEMNRCLTGRIATLHFAPTEKNKQNLENEGIRENVYVVGNTVIDALRMKVSDHYEFRNEQLKRLPLDEGRWIVVTAHRRENLGERLENICRAIKRVAEDISDVHVVYPVHLNPAVRNTVFSILQNIDRVHLIDPIEVDDMHNLLKRAYLVMTDSGGLQEEAPALDKPVVVLRTETERPEVVEAHKAILAGVNEELIYRIAIRILNDDGIYREMEKADNPYGDGHTAERIVEIIKQYYCNEKK